LGIPGWIYSFKATDEIGKICMENQYRFGRRKVKLIGCNFIPALFFNG
jgi:hypothetical protein